MGASIDYNAYIYDYRANTSNKYIAKFKGHEGDINAVKWFPDNNAFVTGSDDQTIRLWDIKCNRQLNKYQHTGNDGVYPTVTSVVVSKSGKYIVSGYDEEPYCLIWNTMMAEIDQTLTEYHSASRVSCLGISVNGNMLVTGSWDKILRCFY